MPPTLATKTVLAIEAALDEERTAAINEIILLIQQLAAKAFSISIEDLSQLVSQDPTITEKVISSANTLGYNPTGTPVTTVSDAIHTVGFERIRNLAMSLMLAENAGTLVNTYEQRDAAALCVCSGMLAQHLANASPENARSEFVFVCASLRSYGRLLLSTFLVEDYRTARSHALEMPEDEAFKLVFGHTPLSLARRILENTNLPRTILSALRDVTPELLVSKPASSENETLIISDLAFNLSKVLLDENLLPEALDNALKNVAARFVNAFEIDPDSLSEAIISIEEKIGALNRAIRLDPRVSPASAKLRARIEGKPLPQPPDYARIVPIIKAKSVEEMSVEERRCFSDTSFEPAFERLRKIRTGRAKFDIDLVLNEVSQSFSQAVNLDNCIVFTRDEFDVGCFSAYHGIGPLLSKIRSRPYVGPSKKDLFSICLTRQEVILIQDITAGKVGTIIPEWIHLAGEISSFIIIPVSAESQLHAIVVGTVADGRKIDLSDTDIRHLRTLRDDLSLMYSDLILQMP